MKCGSTWPKGGRALIIMSGGAGPVDQVGVRRKESGAFRVRAGGALKGERIWRATDYTLFLFRVKMKREEELKRAVSDIATAFTTKLWDTRMRGDKTAESVAKAGKRNGDELAAKILKEADNEK